jgi:uncharacterized Zn finger protein
MGADVRRFGATWWGRAWIDALEQRSGIDPSRLPRGRTYARQDRVARLEVEPGRATALVRGNRALPYRVTVSIPAHPDPMWDLGAAAIAARAASAAALLDGELDPITVADAEEAGVALLPGPGDLTTRCSCPDWADPCKHAAAVCYLVADALDDDPFALFLLRGIARQDLLDRVRHQRSGAPARSPGEEPPASGGPSRPGRTVAAEFGGGAVIDPGTVARDAWARTPEALPERRDLPSAPGAPASWPADPPRDAPFTAAGLTELAADAAARAWAQLADGTPSHLDLDADADLARRAAARLGRVDALLELSRRTGVSPASLTHQAQAWRSAGTEGLAAIEEALWRPPPAVVERGLEALDAAGFDPDDVHVRSNRLTAGDVQLRVTSDGRWWRFERRGRAWELVEPPADDPTELVDADA